MWSYVLRGGYQKTKESGCSSMIKLDAEASEGESLDSGVFRAVLEQSKATQRNTPLGDPARCSQDLAYQMLKDKSKADSTIILAKQIEELHDMKQQNDNLTTQVQSTM